MAHVHAVSYCCTVEMRAKFFEVKGSEVFGRISEGYDAVEPAGAAEDGWVEDLGIVGSGYDDDAVFRGGSVDAVEQVLKANFGEGSLAGGDTEAAVKVL